MVDVNHPLAEIEAEIRHLKVDFDRFFNGALPVPPEERRTQLKRMLRRARSTRFKTFADRFLLSTLEARFNTLNELFNRRLREMETIGPVAKTRRQGPPAPDPAHGVVVGESLDVVAVSALYNRLYSSAGRQAKTDFDSFQTYLQKQVDQLRKRTGCEQVRFRVSEAQGQPTLKAKPLSDGE